MPPTFRLPWLVALNTAFKALYLMRKTGLCRRDVVLCIGQDDDCLLPVLLAIFSGAKLVFLLHDVWNPYGLVGWAIRYCYACMSVTPQLAGLAHLYGARFIKVLPPISSDYIGIEGDPRQRDYSNEPTLGIAGSIGNDALYAARMFSCNIFCISDGKLSPPGGTFLTVIPRFPTNGEALCSLRDNCDVLMVHVSNEYYGYARYAFPSKFLDFVQTGLPVIVVAPSSSPIGEWCKDAGWILYSPSLANLGAINDIRYHLSDPLRLEKCKKQAQLIAHGEFSPSLVHGILDSVLWSSGGLN